MALMQYSSGIRQSTPRSVGRKFQSVIFLVVISLLMVGGIATRLAYLQLAQGDRNRQLADNNRIRTIPKQPVRGNIFDRKGRILASSRFSYSLFIWPIARKQADWPVTLQRLSKILNIPEDEVRQRIEKAGYSSTSLLRVARGLTPAQVTAVEEYRSELEGVEVDIEPVRNYPNGETAAHLLGYTGEMSEEKLARRKDEGYRLGDVIGQMGIESASEKELRGEWGGSQVEVDGRGQVLRILGQKQARAGTDIQLTIDLDLQKAAEKALGGFRGAVVAMDPRNGAVLALVSNPSFDPNIFSSRISPKTWQKVQSKDHPFVNRALRAFPPASTFKIVTTTAAIESGKFSPYTVLQTYPSLRIGGVVFADWNHKGFGPLGFVGAMAWSSDTFFYQIGRAVGGPTLIDWTRRYGFGKKTGIELEPEESSGLVADQTWKRKRFFQPWTVGDSVNMSIGQGFLQATPIQIAVMFAVPANGGYRVQPHLLKDNEESRNWRQDLHLKPETLRVLRQGLRQVVVSGTGKAVNNPNLPPIAGKSGTAEAPPRASHAWFGAYAPYDKPEIVVVAFAEHSGGGGGKIAAPMVRDVLDAYFNIKKSDKVAGKKLNKGN